MNRPPVFGPPHDGVFERVVCDLVLTMGCRVEALEPHWLLARLPYRTRVALVRAGTDLTSAVASLGHRGGDLVVVGGPSEGFDAVKAALPTVSVGAGIRGVHIGGDGRVRATHVDALATWRAIAARNAPPDWERFSVAIAAMPAEVAYDAPIVVSAIAVLIGLMFAAEVVFDAANLPPAMNRLGALVPERVFAGELWRIGSYAFLHANPVHVGMNLMALLSLGPPLERVLGPWRLALVYAVSALAGGVAVVTFTHAGAVGASGAIWGLMTAELLVMWRLSDRVPPAARSRAWRSLGLNLMISLLPGISLAGHLGGGVAGALIAVGFDITRGPSPLTRRLAAACSALLLLSLVLAVLTGGVQSLDDPPKYQRVPIAGTASSVEIPERLVANGYQFGDPEMDPIVVVVQPNSPCQRPSGFSDESNIDLNADGVYMHHQRWRGSDVRGYDLECATAVDANGTVWTVLVGSWRAYPSSNEGVTDHVLMSVVRPR